MGEMQPFERARFDQDMEAVIEDMVERGWITITFADDGARILNMTEEGFVQWAKMEQEEREKGA
jgi:hypothetical protein